MKRRKYKIDFKYHVFNAEDDWGDYCNGRKRRYFPNKYGYNILCFKGDDEKWHSGLMEHVVKWEFFNGEIPEGYEIDHIVPIKDGGTNKLSNLRLVTHQENCNNEHSKENYRKAKLGKKFSEEHKKKIGEALKGNKSRTGMPHSEETKQKMRESYLKRKRLEF